MTGSKAKIDAVHTYVLHIARDAAAYDVAHETPEARAMEDSTLETLKFLKRVAAAKDVKTLLEIEKASLEGWLEYRLLSGHDSASIKTGVRQCEGALKALDLMEHQPAVYKKIKDTLPEKQIKDGLPLDAVRAFVDSQAARLRNIQPLLSSGEKLLTEQRLENLKIIKSVHVAKQKAIFGQTVPSLFPPSLP